MSIKERFSPIEQSNKPGIALILKSILESVLNYFNQNKYANDLAREMKSNYKLATALRSQQQVEEYVRKAAESSGFNIDAVIDIVLTHFHQLPKE